MEIGWLKGEEGLVGDGGGPEKGDISWIIKVFLISLNICWTSTLYILTCFMNLVNLQYLKY